MHVKQLIILWVFFTPHVTVKNLAEVPIRPVIIDMQV